MEKTNYVAKAKQLLAQSLGATALVIIPLAMAPTAQATATFAVLPASNYTCTVVGVACSGGASQLGAPGGGIGVQGVAFFSNGIIESFLSGSSTLLLQMSSNGTLNQTFSTDLPISYEFTLTESGLTIQSWQLDFNLGTSLGNAAYGNFTASGSGAGTFSNSGLLSLLSSPPGGSTLWLTVNLSIETDGGGGTIGVDVPQNSTFDFQTAADSAVPEPGTAGSLAVGLGTLMWFARRRKKS